MGLVVPLVDPLVLGRDSEVLGPGVLADRRLSGQHARLDPVGDVVFIEDLGSTNGTYVDGLRVSRTPLGVGSVVRVGDLLFVRRDVPADHRTPRHPRLVGVSPSLGRVLRSVRTVAPESMSVLVGGETGVGKELVARELHSASGRPGRFVPVHCAGISEGTLLSELFGHRKGSFTGADQSREGLVVRADGGTLFLDEIGDASAGFQTSLLRFLQEGVVRSVGGHGERRVDVRVVAATHVDLRAAVERGEFRADLLARLDRWRLDVPPLRERLEDLPSLAHSFVEDADLPASLLQRLMEHHWPANVRELQSLVRWYVLRRGAGGGLPRNSSIV